MSKNNGQCVGITEVYVHSLGIVEDSGVPINDLAVIKLSGTIDPDYGILNTDPLYPVMGADVFSSGWGRTGDGQQSSILLGAPVIVKPDCDVPNTYGVICAGSEFNTSSVCYGDSGADFMTKKIRNWNFIGRVRHDAETRWYTRMDAFSEFYVVTQRSDPNYFVDRTNKL